MNQQRGWSFIGLFIIALVISLPIYSANALAVSLQITQNSGQAGLPRYLDAQGDVWTVQATINGADSQTINPADVKLKIGNNEAPFQSCSAAPLGVACEYISPLDGVAEGEYAFQVVYHFLNQLAVPDSVSNAEVIKADGTVPVITGLTARQNNQGQILIDFTVNDGVTANVPAVGIKKIEILDADSSNVLQTIMVGQPDVRQWDYGDDGDFNGVVQASLTGEGLQRIKVRAEDRLGHHSTENPIVSFAADFVPPVIQDQINFTHFGRFIGQYLATSDILVNIQEKNLQDVHATSPQTSLDDTPASDCVEDAETEGLWHCRWNAVEVNPDASVAITITAKDQAGNHATRTLSQTFTVDASVPTVEFFGTPRQFEDKSFIPSGKQRIILRASESGAGISADGIRANLQELGKSQSEPPTSCEQTESTFNCYWETSKVFSSDGSHRIGLSKFQDNVGNEGLMPQVELFADTSGPKVEKLELFGVSEIGEKDYFQSNDRMKIKFKAFESTGLYILLNLNDVVNDAKTLYPADYLAQGLPKDAGWKVFTETDGCQREENGRWACELETDALRSGPDNVDVEMKIQDTAGNDVPVGNWPASAKNVDLTTSAEKATLRFELKGVADENNPDYWEVAFGYPRTQLPFVDLDTTELTYTRMPLTVQLHSVNSQAKVVEMNIGDCVPTAPAAEGEVAAPAPELSRTILYGGSFPEGNPTPSATLIMEFASFNGRQLFGISKDTATNGQFQEAKAKYTCRLNIYSLVGRNAIRTAEIQEVQVEVPFAFSVNGAIDENLASRIRNLQDKWWVQLADKLSYVDKILKWLSYISNILQIIITVNQVVDLVTGKMVGIASAAEKSPLGAFGAALRGSCLGLQGGQTASWGFVKYIQVPTQILNCNPSPVGTTDFSWYGKWQRTVLDTYNAISLRGPAGIGATSLYENMYVSMAGLCVPGILYNLNKARELHCRRVFCYAREVPQGIATIDSCDKLYDLQMCEFYWGPALDIMPPFGLLGQIGSMIRNALTSPLGLISLTEVFGCFPLCLHPASTGAELVTCKVVTGLNKVLDIINSILSVIDNRPGLQSSPYCDMVDDINLDELVGQQGQRQSQVSAAETAVQPVTESAAPVQPTTTG